MLITFNLKLYQKENIMKNFGELILKKQCCGCF